MPLSGATLAYRHAFLPRSNRIHLVAAAIAAVRIDRVAGWERSPSFGKLFQNAFRQEIEEMLGTIRLEMTIFTVENNICNGVQKTFLKNCWGRSDWK